MIYKGNPLAFEAGHVFFLHMILLDFGSQLAMTLGHTVVVTDTGCERLSRSDLGLIVA
jgi:Xaa-Pro dipeptidase